MIFPKYTFLLGTLILALFYLSPEPQLWYLDLERVLQGEYWRLLTGHFMHVDGEHLLWNILALIILGFVIEQNNRFSLILSLGVSIVCLDIFLLSSWSHLDIYCGFSGVLNSLLVTALYGQMQKQKSLIFIFIGGICFIKIVSEILMNQALFSNISWPSYPYAHLIGFFSGAIIETTKHFLFSLSKQGALNGI